MPIDHIGDTLKRDWNLKLGLLIELIEKTVKYCQLLILLLMLKNLD